MCNQKGFILPLTLTLCLFLSLALFHLLEVYIVEKRFYSEQEEILIIESLLQMATIDLLHSVEIIDYQSSGEFHYEKGVATYWILEDSHDTLNIQLKVTTNSKRQRVVRLILDKVRMRVKEWIEVTMR
ncbi:competence type IV pilus minor pilin ComGG [Alkalihalobacillus sp. BA299]|uniref:competence type IV pilus minor pilin ComGG n=1 Tax=Alkalihalobacillus sp. BA299 TaxID=2815938 RepID=UPI001ADBF775|nr:competence type IV pilus minor pilin ComGG [Alkalihalobacillus sp. BA299]